MELIIIIIVIIIIIIVLVIIIYIITILLIFIIFSFTSGEFSRFFIQSVTSDGNLKRTGGDSWRVYIRQGPASLAPMVTDNDDGTHEVMFLALEPGNYSAQVFLDYTLCDGFRDPPEDWFIKGNLVVNQVKN